jgi:amino acid permease
MGLINTIPLFIIYFAASKFIMCIILFLFFFVNFAPFHSYLRLLTLPNYLSLTGTFPTYINYTIWSIKTKKKKKKKKKKDFI